MRWPSAIFVRFLAAYALLYAAFGVQSPFLPALLAERGLRSDQIALALAASTAIRVLAGPSIAHAADRWRWHRLSLCLCAAAAAMAGVGYLTTSGFHGLLTVALVHAATLAPIVPVSDAIATTAAQQSEMTSRRFDYGWLRAGGSAAFIAGTFLTGWAASEAGLRSIIWISGLFLLIGGGTGLLLPGPGTPQHTSGEFRAPTLRDCALLLGIAPFRRILCVAALVEGSHALNDSFSVIYWRSTGISLGTVSFLWSESVIAEVLVFLVIGPGLIRRIGPGGGCGLAAAAGVIRWSILACTASPLLLAAAQPLHGVTFALLHLACMRVIVLAVPFRLAATAQSLYGTLCVGLATALLTLVSGPLYQHVGSQAFLVMAALCLMALPMCAGLRASIAVTMTLGILAIPTALARADENRPAGSGDWDVVQSSLCDSAVRAAEQQHHLPHGLLEAIARAESGRPVSALNDVRAWPWTINADGQGLYLESKEAAVAWVNLQASRHRYIDVGCTQIDITFHPEAFASQADAFDPILNADFAAGYLVNLYHGPAKGDWNVAVGLYHSHTPMLAGAYRDRVAQIGARVLRGVLDPVPLYVLAIRQGTLRVPLGAGRSTPINIARQPALHRRKPTACQVQRILGWYLNGRSDACK